ncbi:hypothetical protein QCA50_008381 [Cerrena zonata]|uniref:Uncharacterized protein n=1 Tax=Cerrena zonata TaxID=2478898 RepID=A0AAW0G3Y3_9APHY
MSISAILDTPLAVRFDDECVLIPDPPPQSRMPRLVKRSYSLPIWRRRSSSKSALDAPDLSNPSPEVAAGSEDNHIHFTVAVPSFSTKPRSPSRCETHHQPLVPCLVNHVHDHSPSPRHRGRRPSLPLPPRSDVVTIPLRSCCLDCYPITEESLQEGSAWQEKFTRGARRLRNSSGSDSSSPTFSAYRARRKVSDDLPGFDQMLLQVDEVEKLRKSQLESSPLLDGEGSSSSTLNDDTPPSPLRPSFTRRADSEVMEVSSSTKVFPISPPIEEEDEDQLFPLPRASNSSTVNLAKEMSDLLDRLNVSSSDLDNVPALSPCSPTASSSSPEIPLATPSISHSSSFFPSSPGESIPLSASPPSTPNLHRVTSSERSPWKKPTIHIPTASSILKTGADVLKGFTMGGSSPLVV